jgi:hypothetical protein
MSILTGLDEIFDRHLRVEQIGSSLPHHRHRTSALRLSEGRPVGFDARRLLEEAYARLVSSLERSPRFARSGPSRENWRLEPQLDHSPQNSSLETTLERAIARAAGRDWANQVPAASGLWDHVADKRRAVDLVRRFGDRSFELIELKVESDTPLRAAVEIVQYGLLYALARERYPEWERGSKELLQAKAVHLRVLAPIGYYASFALGWLEHDLDAGLRGLALERFGEPLLASFAFEAFPRDFRWPAPASSLVDQLHRRSRVWAEEPVENPLSPTEPFAQNLKRHLSGWARVNGLEEYVESGRGRPWVLAEEQRKRNLYREEWWRHIEGYEHQWARALNSSQCFAVNLFATLAEDAPAANRFLRQMLPDRGITEADHVRVAFEQSPKGVPERLGERGQPTQIDVFFTVFRERRVYGAIGVEVKLSEPEFGACRGWTGVRDGVPLNPARERCLDGPRVFESPDQQCFMAEREGRKYWSSMTLAGASFEPERLAEQSHCPFRHGLYQMMRNRVTLDVLRSITDAEWCDFAICVHPANADVRLLPEPVAGESKAVDAFRALLRPGGVLEWDACEVLDAIVGVEGASEEWADWMRGKYLLGADAVSHAGRQEPEMRAAQPQPVSIPPFAPPSPSAARLGFEREVRKRRAAFLAVARRSGIEKIGPKIEAAFLGEALGYRLRADIARQLQGWVKTNPNGRYADAIPSATALYTLLFDPAERARIEAAGLRAEAAQRSQEAEE